MKTPKIPKPSSSKKVQITHKFANWYLSLPNHPGERAIALSKVDKLFKEMCGGTFLQEHVHIDIAICTWDGKERKLNGQHTCSARLKMPANWKLVVTVNRYHVVSDDQYRDLYAKIDKGSVRTRSESGNALMLGTEEFKYDDGTHVNKKICSCLQQGYKFWAPFNEHRPSEEYVVGQLRGSYCGLAWNIIPRLEEGLKEASDIMKRQPVYAAMFETFNEFPDAPDGKAGKAGEFWDEVISGFFEVKAKTNPMVRCRKYLRTHAIRPDRVAGKVKTATAPEDMYNVCVQCFNAYRMGKPLGSTPNAIVKENGKPVKATAKPVKKAAKKATAK